MKSLLLQIKNNKIDNLLDKDTYKLYKYLYDYKLDDPLIKTILAGIKASSDLEGIIISLFFNNKAFINNIEYRIFLQEYFPRFEVLLEDSRDIKYRLVYKYYSIIKEENSLIKRDHSKIKEDDLKINRKDKCINTLFKEFLLQHKEERDLLILKKDSVNNFLIYYNTRQRILLETDESNIINFICKYLSNENIENVYEILEDKTYLNIEINNRNLFDTLKYKIIRETLVSSLSLVNLRVEKKAFYLILNKATMTYKELLDKNFLKYLEILKVVKYKKKYILLIEWLKTFIYFGRFDLFKKLQKYLKDKIPREESEVFSTLRLFLKDKKLINLNPFLMKCGYLKDSENSIYSYKEIIERFT